MRKDAFGVFGCEAQTDNYIENDINNIIIGSGSLTVKHQFLKMMNI
jgi:hypothetical protein